MADVIAKLKLDAKEYDGGLAKAKKSLDQFAKQNTSLNGIMAQGISTLTKFAGGFAAVTAATKAFNSVIMDGSQTTGDFVRNGLGAMNDTLGVLASSIATLDFGPLINGLGDVYIKALNARESLDSLNDTMRGMGLVSSEAREAIAEYREVMGDSNATDADKATALKKANDAIKDYGEVIKTARKETDEWVSSTLQAAGGFSFDTTADEVENLVIEYAKLDKAQKNQIREAAKAAAAGRTEYANNVNKYTRSEFTSMGITQSVHRGGTKEQLATAQSELETFDNTNQELLRQNVLFERYSDKELDNMANTIQNINGYSTQALRLQRQLNAAQNTSTSTARAARGGRTRTTAAAEPITSSMTGLADFDGFEKRLRDAFEKSTPSMNTLNQLAKDFKDNMMAATSPEQFASAAAGMENVQRLIDAQPLSLQAGITIDEAVEQEKIQAQLDDMRLQIKADLEISKQAEGGAEGVVDSGKDAQKNWQNASRAISAAGSALSNLDGQNLNIAGSIMQAIADVALSFAMALKDTKGGPWAWIAAAAAGAATMTAVIATIKQATAGSYAQGGIVPGMPNGGFDNTYVYASPGEVILNRAQQENILSQIEPSTASGGVSYVTGEQLATVINNYGRRRGKGELLFG